LENLTRLGITAHQWQGIEIRNSFQQTSSTLGYMDCMCDVFSHYIMPSVCCWVKIYFVNELEFVFPDLSHSLSSSFLSLFLITQFVVVPSIHCSQPMWNWHKVGCS